MDCSAPGAGVRESFGLLSMVSHVERKESEGRRWIGLQTRSAQYSVVRLGGKSTGVLVVASFEVLKLKIASQDRLTG